MTAAELRALAALWQCRAAMNLQDADRRRNYGRSVEHTRGVAMAYAECARELHALADKMEAPDGNRE